MIWTAFKCKSCKEEWADSDISVEEINLEESTTTEEHGQFITLCEDCQ